MMTRWHDLEVDFIFFVIRLVPSKVPFYPGCILQFTLLVGF